MKRLFEVDGKFFEKKPEAKKYRDELNKRKPGEPHSGRYTVARGPDNR